MYFKPSQRVDIPGVTCPFCKSSGTVQVIKNLVDNNVYQCRVCGFQGLYSNFFRSSGGV